MLFQRRQRRLRSQLCFVFEKKNAAILGQGICFNKFTGSRGKSSSDNTNAEYVAQIRSIMDGANVAWQTAELGKVDVAAADPSPTSAQSTA